MNQLGRDPRAGPPVLPTLNGAVDKADKKVNDLGLFDTIGWLKYHNSAELSAGIAEWPNASWEKRYKKPKDHAQPLYILDPLIKSDFRNHIVSEVDNSHVKYRAFDPTQNPRLTAAQAIGEVSASAGAIIPILADEIVDS